ncbi:MAG: nucleotidyltransferase family protein [Firmicutes bacterium]|nr:nucleotidyltransferase family protein [Bacillota bacterium]MBR0517815.1 nucleotidyltransferase family protein [Bacillota bacterium]
MIPVIVLAGGAARRFGSNKLLAELNGLPLVMHAPLRLQKAGGFDVIVMTCHEEVKQLCDEAGLTCLFRSLCKEGLSGSVRAASEHLMERGVPAAVFCGGDQPFLTAETMMTFYCAWQSSGKGLGSCMAEGLATNPTIFSLKYYKDLTALAGDTGGRAVLRANEADCFFYELADPHEIMDIDLPQQLEDARKGAKRR